MPDFHDNMLMLCGPGSLYFSTTVWFVGLKILRSKNWSSKSVSEENVVTESEEYVH